jgi:hypothetical protein
MKKIIEHYEFCSKIILNEKNKIQHLAQLENLVRTFERTWVKIPTNQTTITINASRIEAMIQVAERLTEILKGRIVSLRHKLNYYE